VDSARGYLKEKARIFIPISCISNKMFCNSVHQSGLMTGFVPVEGTGIKIV
jgi:hypothetical protein